MLAVKDIRNGLQWTLEEDTTSDPLGKEIEARACHYYIENRRQCGKDMVVKASGLHLLSNKSFIGASSDSETLTPVTMAV